MKTIIPRTRPTVLMGRPSVIDRAARRAVLSRLARLRSGRLEVLDGGVRQSYGCDATHAELHATVEVRSPELWRKVLLGGACGLADAWIEDLVRCDDLTAMLRMFVRDVDVSDRIDRGTGRVMSTLTRLVHRLRKNTRRGSRENIHAHYDLGNRFFELFLDETMSYSSGIFLDSHSTLSDASRTKIDRLLRKLDLRPKDHLLEIGTGWGGLATYAARNYGCRVTTTTISREQYEYSRDRVRREGLSDRIDVRLEDYRDLSGRYDKLVSVEMVEAVGHEFLGDYFSRCAELLEPDGLAAIQSITMPDHRYDRYRRTVDFIRSHVFPGSCVPSVSALTSAAATASDLRLVHLEDIGPHYARTLREWASNFVRRESEVRSLGYPEEFVRLWTFYLAYCEAGFEERYIGDAQLLFARPGWRGDPPMGAL